MTHFLAGGLFLCPGPPLTDHPPTFCLSPFCLQRSNSQQRREFSPIFETQANLRFHQSSLPAPPHIALTTRIRHLKRTIMSDSLIDIQRGPSITYRTSAIVNILADGDLVLDGELSKRRTRTAPPLQSISNQIPLSFIAILLGVQAAQDTKTSIWDLRLSKFRDTSAPNVR